MSFEWNFDLNAKLEQILLSLIETGPKHLREIADELDIVLKNDSDRNKLRYRMKKIVSKHEELQDFGYTRDGYIIPVFTDEFIKISKPLRSRGEGLLQRAASLDNRAVQIGKRRENQPEQIELFEDLESS